MIAVRRIGLARATLVAATATFVAITSVSMRLYPGGTSWDPAARGQRFWTNFLCDLARPTALDGTPNPLVDFGFNIKDAEGNPVGEIAWSDLFNVIRDTPGVRKMGDARLDLTLNGLPADVRLNVREFPVLRTVTLTNGDTGELL